MPQKETIIDGWVSVHHTWTDYEADMVLGRLTTAGITAVIHSRRDHAYSLNVGAMSTIHVVVRPEDAAAARGVLSGQAVTDAELDAASQANSPIVNPPEGAPE